MRLSMRPTLKVIALTGALALFSGAAIAATGTSITIKSTSRSGPSLVVKGRATFADQPFVDQGTDPANDTTTPPQLGTDLVGASLATTADGRISFRWAVSDMPPLLFGTPTANYSWTFCLNAKGGPPVSCWWVTASRMNWLIPSPDPWLTVWQCTDDPSNFPCGTTTLTSATGDLVFDGVSKTITATIALSDLGASAGMQVTPVIGYSFETAPVWTALYAWYDAVPTSYDDNIPYTAPYDIPAPSVSLAIGVPGQNPATVPYPKTATVAADGSYKGKLNVSKLHAGTYSVYARACFGSNNCAYATKTVKV